MRIERVQTKFETKNRKMFEEGKNEMVQIGKLSRTN
jgi:hypothetical protein